MIRAESVIQSARMAGQVRRYHTWQTLITQTVAEHSWQVARIYYDLFGEVPGNVASYIQWHDAGEIATGDIPFPVKSDHPMLKDTIDRLEENALREMHAPHVEISSEEKLRVKLCDLLEMWEFGTQEVLMGNRFAEPIVARTIIATMTQCEKFPDTRKMVELVTTHFESYNKWRYE